MFYISSTIIESKDSLCKTNKTAKKLIKSIAFYQLFDFHDYPTNVSNVTFDMDSFSSFEMFRNALCTLQQDV